jgi:hypothetical protein
MADRIVSSSEAHDMSEGWMKDNPELAGKALLQFFREHPPEEWNLTIRRAFMPGMFLTLSAVRKK